MHSLFTKVFHFFSTASVISISFLFWASALWARCSATRCSTCWFLQRNKVIAVYKLVHWAKEFQLLEWGLGRQFFFLKDGSGFLSPITVKEDINTLLLVIEAVRSWKNQSVKLWTMQNKWYDSRSLGSQHHKHSPYFTDRIKTKIFLVHVLVVETSTFGHGILLELTKS